MTTTRVLAADEVAELLSWAKREGWNPGIGDAEAFRLADPNGFWGAFDGDRLAAGISVVRYGDTFGFLGLYIAHPDYRGKGYGKAVWQAGMDYLDGRTIGLDGVPDLQPYYQSVGFVKAHDTLRYTGQPKAGAISGEMIDVVALADARVWDMACFPSVREGFLANWLNAPRIVRALTRDGQVVAYGVVRACEEGHKVGPLFAGTAEDAKAVLAALSDAVSGDVIVDVPSPQAAFRIMLEMDGMSPAFGTARMYKGPPPQVNVAKVFGLTTLELG